MAGGLPPAAGVPTRTMGQRSESIGLPFPRPHDKFRQRDAPCGKLSLMSARPGGGTTRRFTLRTRQFNITSGANARSRSPETAMRLSVQSNGLPAREEPPGAATKSSLEPAMREPR